MWMVDNPRRMYIPVSPYFPTLPQGLTKRHSGLIDLGALSLVVSTRVTASRLGKPLGIAAVPSELYYFGLSSFQGAWRGAVTRYSSAQHNERTAHVPDYLPTMIDLCPGLCPHARLSPAMPSSFAHCAAVWRWRRRG